MVERPETSPASIRLKMEVEKYPPVVVKDGQGWDYFKVKPESGDFEIVKYNYDAFRETQLEEHLQAHGVKKVIIEGGHASVCVDTTARTASQLGYHTFVPADLTADPELSDLIQSPEYMRKKLDTINSVMGYMPLAKTILDIWNVKNQ
jgi:nicotinamidase-related amidase